MIKVKAVGHRVIVIPDPVEEVTKGGIVLAVDKKREEASAQKGTVHSVGPSAWKSELYGYGKPGWEPWCVSGDRIFFARYAGKIFRDGKQIYMVINDDDVQCLITDESVEAENEDE